MTWPIRQLHGSAADLHGRAVTEADAGSLWWLEVARPTIVLGSAQRSEVVDAEAAAQRGIEVARRRSGGGAVLVDPATTTWIDVLLGRDDPRWTDDVSRSFDWLGRAWAQVLADVGVPGAVVHPGPMVHRPWSTLVCFGGVGPGEVLVDGRKVIGISQRRTREVARFQCAVLHRWDPEGTLAALRVEDADRAAASEALAEAGVGVDELGRGRIAPHLLVEGLATLLRQTTPAT